MIYCFRKRVFLALVIMFLHCYTLVCKLFYQKNFHKLLVLYVTCGNYLSYVTESKKMFSQPPFGFFLRVKHTVLHTYSTA